MLILKNPKDGNTPKWVVDNEGYKTISEPGRYYNYCSINTIAEAFTAMKELIYPIRMRTRSGEFRYGDGVLFFNDRLALVITKENRAFISYLMTDYKSTYTKIVKLVKSLGVNKKDIQTIPSGTMVSMFLHELTIDFSDSEPTNQAVILENAKYRLQELYPKPTVELTTETNEL